jgi:hypothetical protein
MIKARAHGRRLADACFGFATWIAAIAVALIFYDWIGRWYVAAAAVVAFVFVAMIAERTPSARERGSLAHLAVLPLPVQRSTESVLEPDLPLELQPNVEDWLSEDQLPA